MNKTGKIVAYEPNGTAEIKGRQYNRYMVTFADGQKWKFLSTGEFKKQIGDEVEYIIKNEEYKNASFVVENNFNQSKPMMNSKATTNDSILLQVCYKENMQAYAKENRGIVINNTKEDFLSLKQILNNL
jgi:hypothetical protein